MLSWAAQELGLASLARKSHSKRLIKMLEAFAAQPAASVPQACGSWAATKAAYRFWDNPQITPLAIWEAHFRSTQQRATAHSLVLAIQDTTNLDFTHHPATKDLGYLDQATRKGLKVHSVLLASDQGVPLGLVHQEVWQREESDLGRSKQRRHYQTADKESGRWLRAQTATLVRVAPPTRILTIADREADIFDLFHQERAEQADLLIRIAHNRKVVEPAGYLQPLIAAAPISGWLKVEVKRGDEREGRLAELSLRYRELELAPPRNQLKRSSRQPVKVRVILAQEEEKLAGVEPIKWLLLTTLALGSGEEAGQCVRWYSQRWLIERYHYVLKSGCLIEELQLETAERLERALATYGIVAWRLLWLVYESRRAGEQSCEVAFSQSEWQGLYSKEHQTRQVPAKPPSLREMVRWVAKLGGFLGRKGDGEPGVKTLWRGMRRLSDIAETWELLHTPPRLSD